MVEGLSDKLDGGRVPDIFAESPPWSPSCSRSFAPICAFFGQKDAAQVAVLRKMVRDLDMDVEVVVCPIVREKDGLAMSSRNVYLTPEQRQQALVLHRSLLRVQAAVDHGERDAAKLREIGETGDCGGAGSAAGLLRDRRSRNAGSRGGHRARRAGRGRGIFRDDAADRQFVLIGSACGYIDRGLTDASARSSY